MKYVKAVIGAGLCSVLAITNVRAQSGSAAEGKIVQGSSLTVTQTVSPQQQAVASTYWTRARIAAAPAMALPIDKGSSAIDIDALDAEAATGPAGSTAPGVADPNATRIAQAVYAQDWAALEKGLALEEEPTLDASANEPASAGTANVFTFYDVNGPAANLASFGTIFPHRWIGKLTFITPAGGSSCSATAISRNNIVTAAHCVYDTTNNRFYSNWVFMLSLPERRCAFRYVHRVGLHSSDRLGQPDRQL